MSRQSQLLKAAAQAMENSEDPFHESFLRANGVTLDECFDLAELLALGARLMAWAIENPVRAKTALSGAADTMRMDTITRVLQKMNGAGR